MKQRPTRHWPPVPLYGKLKWLVYPGSYKQVPPPSCTASFVNPAEASCCMTSFINPDEAWLPDFTSLSCEAFLAYYLTNIFRIFFGFDWICFYKFDWNRGSLINSCGFKKLKYYSKFSDQENWLIFIRLEWISSLAVQVWSWTLVIPTSTVPRNDKG